MIWAQNQNNFVKNKKIYFWPTYAFYFTSEFKHHLEF